MSIKKKIAILTTTRAEYGLLRPVIRKLINDGEFEVRVAVTGMHLSSEFGSTYKEIEKDGIPIAVKIPILLSDDSSAGISKTMGLALAGFGDWFMSEKPDYLIVLGDRYETLAVCCAALNARIPIVHLHGGETTEGAADEAYRHAITKMSALHLTSTEEYRKRVIQLGENPETVFCTGALGVENVLAEKLLTRDELAKQLDFPLDKPYASVTFHPVTLENNTAETQINELLKAVDAFPNMKFIFTKANSDADGRVINSCIGEYAKTHPNILFVASLGLTKYLSAVKYASMVLGNSSSGLIEAPSFGIPTVNIGDRQKGRIQAESVINCEPKADEIIKAMQKALSDDFAEFARGVVNPYGDGKTTEKVVSAVKKLANGGIDIKKKFYDVDFNA